MAGVLHLAISGMRAMYQRRLYGLYIAQSVARPSTCHKAFPRRHIPSCRPMSSNAKPRVFVTGASGFLGSHVVFQLLEAGYPVIGAARGSKLPLLERVFARYPDFEAVDVPDVASSELTEKLKGVEAIIHTAAPLPGRADVETLLKVSPFRCRQCNDRLTRRLCRVPSKELFTLSGRVPGLVLRGLLSRARRFRSHSPVLGV